MPELMIHFCDIRRSDCYYEVRSDDGVETIQSTLSEATDWCETDGRSWELSPELAAEACSAAP